EGLVQIGAQITEETAGREYNFLTGKGLHTQQLNASWDKRKISAAASLLHYNFGGWGGDQYNRAHAWMPKQQLIPSLRLAYKGNNWDLLYRNDYLIETITSKSEISRDYTSSNKFFITNRMAHQAQFSKQWNSRVFWNTSLGYTHYSRA